MRFLRIFLRIIGVIVLVLLLVIATMITTMDNTPYKEMPYYGQWKRLVSNVKKDTSGSIGQLQAGWAKVNITPASPTPTAGYGNRRGKLYTAVHDSVYVRAMVIDNGETQAAIIAADLLIVPPTVIKLLQSRLTEKEIPFDQVFFGATHSHNSVGGWGTGISSLFFSGKYDPATVERLADAIFQAIVLAKAKLEPVDLTYMEAIDTVDIRNRLVGGEGEIDPEIRSAAFVTKSGKKAILSSYAAHSTVLNSKNIVLSRDYPGMLVDSLEKGRYDFAMYMAGAVGSMGPIEKGADDFDEVKNQAYGVQKALLSDSALKMKSKGATLQAITLPLPLRDPSPRLTMNINLRSWAFKKAFGEYPVFVKALRIGNILMVGMPCDFSGELVAGLDAYAKTKGINLLVTSFNGGYIGYITHDKYFDKDLYETKTMSWYGPYNGAYLQEVIKDIIDKLS
ncbi:neutral/alkaline non-lysosomal ceramidase N-terminal domain-containing protein [Dyadobacter fanqingshengii]|uniref:Neutral/alkaline non-lysosomal ceramidase N-terminal domain-containing protein n=1 Tax=Dyadobacter fanqingshengii TaxID=2906443 RepID=A0A9X1TEW7_9BACT|nr:neutral/alkaline non-lysosomal ceramidase N-terminal domain-containing protein [Dyadobacter fanqingshengii]MCF0038917.1 neutral/alkaline non-lysosomal ceramidase N-terminal domain-containing protein [Dyadobacter fanqingshengii]MCF2503540.1 neutral/alkaline non-lysosomal ceramidase N-terminal domain-containing protein [Dyadobacter fanqingshengii]USJ34259.1 neutral/alkaline non-lysosomal ceramidase N-terminal domain-containing protein [Dyadobacter fanqingshengii]